MTSLFEYIKSQINIFEIVSGYVQLKSAGFYMKGSCPFHSEKDASFTVSPDKQIFYCFGCHASGDAVAFVAKIENLSQLQAAKYLIERYSIVLPEEIKNSKNFCSENVEEKDSYFTLCKTVALWANQQLLNDKFALEYIKKRGINFESIKSYLIGYFPGGVNKVNRFIKDMQRENILLKNLLEYGILVEGHSNIYSPFEERILFPIRDSLNRYSGFGGRVFKEGDDRPKYYNSRESEGFVKGKLLFSFDLAKKHMQEKGFGFLVEGYMDCIMMHQYGYKNTVATLGTACTIQHLRNLSRCIKILHVLYDGDKAGQGAILRMAEFCWEAKLDLKVIQLPANEDPASLLEKGDCLDRYLQKAVDIFSFFIESHGANFQQKPLSEKIYLAEKIVAVISNLNDFFKQDLLLAQAAMIMNLPFESLKNLMGRYMHRKPAADLSLSSEPSLEPCLGELNQLEESIFFAILNSGLKSPYDMLLDKDLLPYFSKDLQRLMYKLYEFTQSCNEPTNGESELFSRYLDSLEQCEKNLVIRISMKNECDISKESFEQLVLKFCKVNWKRIVHGIKDEMTKAKEANDTVRLNELLSKFLKFREGMQVKGLI